jgi:hypothetical protein
MEPTLSRGPIERHTLSRAFGGDMLTPREMNKAAMAAFQPRVLLIGLSSAVIT